MIFSRNLEKLLLEKHWLTFTVIISELLFVAWGSISLLRNANRIAAHINEWIEGVAVLRYENNKRIKGFAHLQNLFMALSFAVYSTFYCITITGNMIMHNGYFHFN